MSDPCFTSFLKLKSIEWKGTNFASSFGETRYENVKNMEQN